MRHAVELNHVAECEHLRARRPVGLCWLHPVTPSGVALYRPARGAPLAVRSRLARIRVRSRPRRALLWWVSHALPTRGRLPRHLSVLCYNIHCHHLMGESQAPSDTFCTICPDSAFPAVHQRLERPFASLRPRSHPRSVLPSLAGRLATLPVGLEPAHGPCLPPAGRAVSCADVPPFPLAARVAPV